MLTSSEKFEEQEKGYALGCIIRTRPKHGKSIDEKRKFRRFFQGKILDKKQKPAEREPIR